MKRWAAHLDDIRTEIADMEDESPPQAALLAGAHDAINTAIRCLDAATKPDTDAHRFARIRSFLNVARSTAAERDGGRVPVESSRLRQIRQYCDNSLATLGWFDQPYKDDKRNA